MYEKYFPNTEKSFINREVVSKTGTISIGYDYPQKAGYDVDMTLYKTRSGNVMMVGISTGLWVNYNGENYLQILGNFGEFGYGYVNANDINPNAGKIVTASSDTGAQKLLNKLINNNKTLAENNLLCAGMMQKIVKSGKKIPVNYTNTLSVLHGRLQARNSRLINSPYLEKRTQSSPAGYNRYSDALSEIVSNPENPSIGIAPVIIYVVVSAIITALLGWIVYLIFKPDYTDSEADLVVSNNLMKALDTLTPEAKAEVIADLEGQIDKAFIEGKLKGKKEGSASMFKNIGLFAAGIGVFFAARPALERLGVSEKQK